MSCISNGTRYGDGIPSPLHSTLPPGELAGHASGADPLQGINALERLLAGCPDDAVLHHDLATEYSRLGDREKALHHYLEAVRLNRGRNSYQRKLVGALYIETGKLAQAADLYLELLDQSPKDTEVLFRLGMVSELTGQPAEAEYFYLRFLELEPANRAVLQRLARLRHGKPAAGFGLSQAPETLREPARPEVREVRVQATVRLVESKYTEVSEWFRLAAKDKADHIVSLCNRNRLSPMKVLEIGAGGGAILACLDQLGFAPELHALEVSPSGVEVIRGQKLPSVKHVAVFDGYNTPYRDQEFDLVILSHVIEHVEYERLLLREMQRISRHQVIEIPLDYGEGVDRNWLYFTSYGHINLYNPALLRFLLATERFEIMDEIAAPYSLEVMQYVHFENACRPRTPEALERFNESYRLEREARAALPVPEQEKLASSYTVLTRRMTDAELFRSHLEFATHYHTRKQEGELMLILGSLRNHGLEHFAPLPSWAVSRLKENN